jgi:hypothetical protein
MFMRKLSQITATVLRYPAAPRNFGRRSLSAVVGHLTCLMLFKHGETETVLIVSDNADALDAVSLPKALVALDARDRGRFLVATLSAHVARSNGLGTPLIERTAFLPEELADLNDAIATAKRTRDRLCGHVQPMGWSGGRNVFA